jgi:hypothetical protein
MTACDLRRLAGRLSLLRAHVELAAVCERDGQHRDALERLRVLLVEGERGMAREADAANAEVTQ